MLDKRKLKELSHICAYCNIALRNEDKTVDHIVPKCANGTNEIMNSVICCEKCNVGKCKMDINSYLSRDIDVLLCFENYLNLIDYQLGNTEYSEAIKSHIGKKLYKCSHRCKKHARMFEKQTIKYSLNSGELCFMLNPAQAKILDYYLANEEEEDYKIIAKKLRMTKSEFKSHTTRINCLTGLFIMKNVSQNGIRFNKLFQQIIKV